MKINSKPIIKRIKGNIFSSKGSSYLEFIFSMLAIIFIIYTFLQFYFLLNEVLLMQNTAKVALRNMEVLGGVVQQDILYNGVYGHLAMNNNIDKDSIVFKVNGVDFTNYSDNTWFQIRTPIEVELSATYNIMSGLKLGPHFGVPIYVRYKGSSQRINKTIPFDDNLLIYN